MDLKSRLHTEWKTCSWNNWPKTSSFCPILFWFGMPQTFSTCPYRFPMVRRSLVYLWIWDSWFVTPRGIWPHHDQTNPFSYYMKEKSERTTTVINFNYYDPFEMSTFVALEGWPQDLVLVQYAFCNRDGCLFLIRVIDVSALTGCTDLGIA